MARIDDTVGLIQSCYRNLWTSVPGIGRHAEFDGSLSDIDDLCYLQYEGIEHDHIVVDELQGVETLAVLVGQVLVRQAGFTWSVESGQWLLVYHDGSTRVAAWPYGRLVELRRRNRPQYGVYRWMVAWILHECSSLGVLSEAVERWNGILHDLGYDHLRTEP